MNAIKSTYQHWLLAGICIALSWLGGCQQQDQKPVTSTQKGTTIEITQQQLEHGEIKVSAKAGETLQLRLPLTAGTGYSWQHSGKPPLQPKSVTPKQQTNLVGAPEYQEFAMAVKEGMLIHSFALRRPWEQPQPTDQSFQLTIIIE